MNTKTKGVVSVLLVFSGFIGGCNTAVRSAIGRYHQAAPQIQLGMSKDQVLAMLNPTQESLPLGERRAPDQYLQDDLHVEIYFYRSNSNYDGILTDDEMTPYIFLDGKLHAIGWTWLNGPKTQALPTPVQQINIVR